MRWTGIVQTIVYDKLGEFFEENPSVAKQIVEKALLASKAREVRRKARDLTRRKGVLEGGRSPWKIGGLPITQSERVRSLSRRGDSGRFCEDWTRSTNPSDFAVLRKILNVERQKHNAAKVFQNQEIQTMIRALGAGVGNNSEDEGSFDPEKLRYSKIIIMTDADVDGAHIRTLMLTFLWRFMRPAIEQGHVFIAQPPLFQLTKGRVSKYVL